MFYMLKVVSVQLYGQAQPPSFGSIIKKNMSQHVHMRFDQYYCRYLYLGQLLKLSQVP